MRGLLWKSAAVCAVVLVGFAGRASAQVSAIRADVPFAFTAANQLLPAGEYRFSFDVDHRVVRISEEHGNRIWLVRVTAGGQDRDRTYLDQGMLRFTRHGQRHYLNGLWLAGSVAGKAVMPSKVPPELGAVTIRDIPSTR